MIALFVAGTALAMRSCSNHQMDLARRLARSHRFAAADQRLQSAASWWYFNRAEVAFQRARVAWTDGEIPVAETLLEAASAAGLEAWRIKRERSLIRIRNGEAAAMLPRMESLVDRGSVDDVAAVMQAYAAGFLAQGDPRGAQHALSVWEKLDADDPRIPYWRGFAIRAFRDPRQAVESFQAALALEPAMTPARRALAEILVGDELYRDALPHYRDLSQQSELDESDLVGLGECLLKSGQVEEGTDLLEAYVQKHPHKVRPRLALAEHWLSVGESDKVVRCLEPLLERGTIEISLHYLLAAAYANQEDPQRSEAHFDLFQKMNRQYGTLSLLKKQYQTHPDPALARQLAEGLMECRWQDAGTWIIASLRHQPRDRRLHLLMADYLDHSGRAEAAESYRSSAAALNGGSPGTDSQ